MRAGARLDPQLAHVVANHLERAGIAELPDALADVAEWIGAGEYERGLALRDVLRLYGTIAQSRDPVREPEPRRFPRFEIRSERQLS